MFRIGSFNIHSLYYCESHRIRMIIDELMKHDMNIICLQETCSYVSEIIANKMGYSYKYNDGNAILTNCNLIEYAVIKLPIDRYAIMATIKKKNSSIKIINTHLDHILESNRMKQIQTISNEMYEYDVLVGDMNSVRVADYSREELIDINRSRTHAKIENIQPDVINYIEEHNFITNEFIEETCPYDTRIDYIFYKPTLKFIDSVVVDTMLNNISDHNLIITTLEGKALSICSDL